MVDLDPSDGFSWIWVSNDLDSGDDSICRGPWLNLEMQKSWQSCLQEYRKLQRLARHMCTLGLWVPSCTLRRGSIFCFACALRCFPSHCQLHIWQLRSTEISKRNQKPYKTITIRPLVRNQEKGEIVRYGKVISLRPCLSTTTNEKAPYIYI